MSGAENALPIDESGDNAEVIALNFGTLEAPPELEAEDLILSGILSDSSRDYIIKQAGEHDTHPFEVIDAAVQSHKELCELLELGGSIYVRDRAGRMHRIPTGDSEPPTAV